MGWPGERRRNLTIRIHDDERAAIDAQAAREGLTQPSGRPNTSELVRRAIRHYLKDHQR